MDTFPLRLDRYFFTQSIIRANPLHNPDGQRDGSKIAPSLTGSPVEGEPRTFAVEVTITLDEDESDNPPYFFAITAFALLVSDEQLPPDAALPIAHATGFNMLIGAIREHLASVTARGPWGAFFFGPVPIQFAPRAGLPADD